MRWEPNPKHIYLNREEVSAITGLGKRALQMRVLAGEIEGYWMNRNDGSGHHHGGERHRKVYRLADVLGLKTRKREARAAATSRRA